MPCSKVMVAATGGPFQAVETASATRVSWHLPMSDRRSDGEEIKHPARTLTRCHLLVGVLLLVCCSPPAYGQFGLYLHVEPPEPSEVAPVSLTVGDTFSDTCYQVCDVVGYWVGPWDFNGEYILTGLGLRVLAKTVCIPH